jgi:histidyl-tRNA synthetase
LLALEKQDYDFDLNQEGILLLIPEDKRQAGFKLADQLRKQDKKVELGLVSRPLQRTISYAQEKGLTKILSLAPEKMAASSQELEITVATRELAGIKVGELDLAGEGLDE